MLGYVGKSKCNDNCAYQRAVEVDLNREEDMGSRME